MMAPAMAVACGAGAQVQVSKKAYMNASKLIGVLLIAAGALGLVVGSFHYTKETQAVKLGPLELTVKEKETVNVPVWAGLSAIALGAVLLVLGGRKP